MATARSYFNNLGRMERRIEQKRALVWEYRSKAERRPNEMEMSIICLMDLERDIASEQAALEHGRRVAREAIAMLPDRGMRRALESRYLSGRADVKEPLGAMDMVAKYLPGGRDHDLVKRRVRGRWR